MKHVGRLIVHCHPVTKDSLKGQVVVVAVLRRLGAAGRGRLA